MTESEIQEFKETLQNKLNALAPKKIKGLTKVEVIGIFFEESTWEGYPGMMDITIDTDFDWKNGYDITRNSKIKNFTKNLASVLLQNDTNIYVYFY